MAAEKLELRVNVERELLRQVDAIGQLYGWDRTQTVTYILGKACNRVHEKAFSLVRMSGGNPMPLEISEPNSDLAPL